MVKKKLVFFLMDGLADVSIPDLDFKTPLQYAKKPNMDALSGAREIERCFEEKIKKIIQKK